MNLLDFLIIIPILFFALRGIKNGLIGEVLGIIGLIAAVYLTFQFMDEAAGLIRPLFNEDDSYVIFVAGALIFIIILILAQLLDYFSGRLLIAVRLYTVNSILGFFFGLIKGAIIISAILLLLAGFQIPSEQSRKESVTYSYIIYLAPWAYNTVAIENFTETIEETFEKYNSIEDFPIVNE